jgi:mannosyltransferase
MSADVVGARRVAGTTGSPAATGGRRQWRWATVGVVLVVGIGVALRIQSPSALWLDEAVSLSISGLPIRDVVGALRLDGAPPLYAFLLWAWERLVGTTAFDVRLLSALFGITALPVAAAAGSRLAGRMGGVAALLLLATSPRRWLSRTTGRSS